MDTKTQNILAIVIGLLVITAVGAALIPIMKMALVNFYSYSMKNGIAHKINIYTYFFLFIAIPSFMGGYVTCWIAVDKKISSALKMGLVAFLILDTVGAAYGGFSWGNTLASLTIIPFAVMGAIVRRLIENKSEEQNY